MGNEECVTVMRDGEKFKKFVTTPEAFNESTKTI
jgi:hypothetical protein